MELQERYPLNGIYIHAAPSRKLDGKGMSGVQYLKGALQNIVFAAAPKKDGIQRYGVRMQAFSYENPVI